MKFVHVIRLLHIVNIHKDDWRFLQSSMKLYDYSVHALFSISHSFLMEKTNKVMF